MDSKQIDAAMKARRPVLCGGTRYERIVEFISWYDDQRIRRLSAVLLAEQGNFTVRVPAEKVALFTGGYPDAKAKES